MRHSTPKRLLAVVLSLLMMFTVVQSFPENIFRDSAITADAASDPITDKINIIKGLFPTGTAFTANGYKNNPKDKNANANSNCYLPNIMKSNPKIKSLGLKYDPAVYSDGYSCYSFASFLYGYIFGKNFKTNSIEEKTTSITDNGMSSFFSQCRKGDLIEWGYKYKGGHHYVIFLSYDAKSKTMYCYDNNMRGECSTNYNHGYGHKWFMKGDYTVYYLKRYRAKNYDKVSPVYFPKLSSSASPASSNTAVTLKPTMDRNFGVQTWSYFISTDKSAISKTDATNCKNHKNNGSVEYVRAYDYGSNLKSQKSVNINVKTYKKKELQANTTYYYKVAVKVYGQWYSTGVGSVTTSNSVPGKTTVKVSKGSDIIGIGDQAGILWDEASNAKSYDIIVKDSEGNTVQTKTGITGLSYALDGFAKEGVYTVGITAINTAGKTEGVSADITVKPDVKVSFYDSIDAEGKDIKTLIETVSVHYGHNADLPKSPAHEGCTFSKWNGTYEAVTADSEVVAEYDCAYYTVKFIDSFTNTVLSTQRIRYSASATAPEVTAPEGYIFTSWNKDFSNVKSDLSVSTVYKWADEDHSATVKIDKARKNITDKGYDVTATVTNRTDEIISGRLVAVLLSENGTILAKAESAAFAVDRAADGAPVDKEVSFTVLYPNLASKIEVYAVDSYDSLGKLSKTAYAAADNSTLTDWTDYITYTDDSEVPQSSDTLEVESGLNPVEKTYYRYQVKESTTNYATTLDGYTQDGYTAVKDSTGTIDYVSSWPSGFNKSNAVYTKYNKTPVKASENATSLVKVDSTSTVGYIYWHWCSGKKLEKPYNRTIDYSKTGTHTTFHAFYSTKNVTEMSPQKDAYKYSDIDHCADTYWWGRINVTRQNYTTYKKLYNYSKVGAYTEWTELKEGESLPVEGAATGDDKNKTYAGVETKTVTEKQYRYRAKSDKEIALEEPVVSAERIIDISGRVDAASAGKDATVWVYKYDQASDYTTEFVKDTKVGEDGTVKVEKAALLEAPSVDTGDFSIVLSIDGQTQSVSLGTIKAPKPEYTVKFVDFDGETVISEQKVKEGENAELPDRAKLTVPAGRRFTNWSESVVNIRSDMVVKPESEAEVYTAAFVNWEVKSVELRKFSYGEQLVADSMPEGKDGFITEWVVQDGKDEMTIDEFNASGKTVTSDMIIVTRSTPKKYTVTFLASDSQVKIAEKIEASETLDIEDYKVASEVVVENGENINFEEAQEKVEENPDIVFLGWINAETGEAVGDTTAYESAVLYPVYSFNETTEDPVSDIATGEYTTPQKVTLSSDTENAVIWYTLDGSDPRTSSTAAEYKEPVEISKSCTLRMYAGAVNHNDSSESSYIYVINNGETVYHIVTVTNVFDVDTGIDGSTKVYLVAHGAKLKDFTSDEFEGYEYDSLYFDEEFKEQYFENEEVIGETQTLFAKYVSKKYKVTYVDDAGKVISEQEVAYLNNAEAPKAPEHEGMVFVGWDKSGEGISADTTITAKYIAKEAYAEVSLNRRKDIYITVDGAYNKLAATITPSELSAYELRWTSSNPSAADVDEEGKITANGVGDTEITVTIVETGSSASVKVHVTGLTLSGKATAGFDSARNLRGIKAGENTAAQIKAQFANDEVTITAADGTVAADDAVVGTGARVNLTDSDGTVIDSAIIIISGDYTGDGNVNNKDLAKLNAYVAKTGTVEADDMQMTALDVNGDGSINNRDCALLSRYLVGKEEI
ncbi:repeat domain (List_Bact_rpt) [Ruminococcus sp. YRD2003]|uniref:InlB B-repeat-containing protein n=1 Tax=Ruminococcus sp. YRD2003 TaxID=1452313 RepID=UPI0008C1B833|nr:repeat domain (List_Bact_rpt) [Ruminococcus flavefaciens]